MKIKNLIYYAYGLMILNITLISNFNTTANIITRVIVLFLAMLVFFFSKITVRSFTKLILILVALSIMTYFSRDYNYIYLAVFIFGCKDISMDKIVKFDFVFRFIGFSMTIILFMFGILDDNTATTPLFGSNIVRHSIGFFHPNTLYLNFFLLVVDYSVIKNNRIRITGYVSIILLSVIVLFISFSRTGFILLFMYIILTISDRIFHFTSKRIFVKFVSISFLVLFIMSVVSVFLYQYGNYFIVNFDFYISGRIRSAYYFITTYGVNFFGSNIEIIGTHDALVNNTRSFILDNSYLYVLVTTGFFGSLFFILYNFIIVKKIVKMERLLYLIPYIIFVVYGLTESMQINIAYNYLLLIPSVYIFNTKIGKKNELN